MPTPARPRSPDAADQGCGARSAGRRALLGALGAAAGLAAAGLPARGGQAGERRPGVLRVAGSGALLPAMDLLAEACAAAHPGFAYRLVPSLGSSGSIAAALAGAVDLALAARPPGPAELAAGAVGVAYARTPLVFATHARTPVAAITAEDAARAYAGEATAWPDGAPLRLIRRPSSEAEMRILREGSPRLAAAVEAARRRHGLYTPVSDQENADALEGVRGSFGSLLLGQALAERRRLVMPALDGTVPGAEAVEEGRWPLTATLWLVARGHPADVAGRLAAFAAAPAGRALLRALGHAAPFPPPPAAAA